MKEQGTSLSTKVKKTSTAKAEVSIIPELTGQSFASAGYGRLGRSGPLGLSNSVGGMFSNIEQLDNPFECGNGLWNAQHAISLCQKAYYRVPVFRTAVDIMTDLFNSEIHLEGGNAQSLKFFQAWLKRIGIHHVSEQFGRECTRSGNVIFYRTDSLLSPADVLKMGQTYATKDVAVPIRYTLINPACIRLNNFAFDVPVYYRLLSPFELEQLSKSQDPDDNKVAKSIKQAVNNYVNGVKQDAVVQLDDTRLHTVFYQKQDYEPMATPMGFCVLDDINLQLEFKKSDAILAKTVEYIILLVTMGQAEKDGGTDPVAYKSLMESFKNEKVGRVLVADYTTKADFIIPDLSKILTPDKYEEVNKNISAGLMNIFFGDQKFADSVTKLRAVLKKIENMQQIFLCEFLQKEIKRIAKIMNFKSYPLAYFEPIRLEDQAALYGVYAQLAMAGVLTPKDAVELMETGLLPDYENLEQNQVELRKAKDQGLFEPAQGGPFSQQKLADKNATNQVKLANIQAEHAKVAADQSSKNVMKQKAHEVAVSPPVHKTTTTTTVEKPVKKNSGRPKGKKAKQTTKKVGQTGASEDSEDFGSFDDFKFSQKEYIENTLLYSEVKREVQRQYKAINEIKRMTGNHKEIAQSIAATLLENEIPEDWMEKIPEYIKELPDLDMDAVLSISTVQEELEETRENAALIYHSQI